MRLHVRRPKYHKEENFDLKFEFRVKCTKIALLSTS